MRKRTKFTIEGIVAVSAIALMLWAVTPHFLRAQYRANATAIQTVVDEIYRSLSTDPDLMKRMNRYSRISSPSWSGPLTRRGGEKVLLYTHTMAYILFNDRIADISPAMKRLRWDYGDMQFYVFLTYGKAASHFSSKINEGFLKTPFYMNVFAKVGANLNPNGMHSGYYWVDVDEEGFYKINAFHTPYAPSNRIQSDGEFMRDSVDDWPEQKAVLVDKEIPIH